MKFKISNPLLAIILIHVFSCTSKSDETVKTDSSASAITELNVPKKELYLVNDTLFKTVHLCTERFPPLPPGFVKHQKIDTVIFPRSNGTEDVLISPQITPPIAQIRSLNFYVWKQDTLRVTFLDGDSVVIKKVMQTAKIWENYCRVRFVFGNFTHPDISISFMYQGSWSYIGSYSSKVSPSMNFGWLDLGTSDVEYHRVVLHEFGHALGFIHEHQSPVASIPWNKPLVYQYYGGKPNFWDHDAVDQNIFYKYSKEETQGTDFDPKSIMLYAIPAELTDGIFHTDENDDLSQTDIGYVSRLYPK